MKTQVMEVTPEMAAVWLEKNKNNRPIRARWVKELSDMIKRDEFKLTHQGIAFDQYDNLLDGQHRLMAIVSADKPVQMLVTKGAATDTFSVLDVGKKRAFSDMYGCSLAQAAVSRIITEIIYDRSDVLQQAKIHALTGPVVKEITEFCPQIKRGISVAPVIAAATIRILGGADREYVKLTYWNLVHMVHSELPPIGRSFIDQVFSGTMKYQGYEGARDAITRALKVFDYNQRMISSVRVKDLSFSASVDLIKSIIVPLVDGKKPPVKPGAIPRAKTKVLSPQSSKQAINE